MNGNADFEVFMQRIVAHETSSIDHEHHPTMDLFLDEMAGELAPEVHAHFVAHLATCPECRTQRQTLTKTFKEEEETLHAHARVSSFVDLVRQRRAQPRLGARASEWLRALWPAQALKPALAVIATIALTLAVAIPLLRGPMVTTSERLSGLTREVETLQSKLDWLARGGIGIPANMIAPKKTTLDELAQLVSNVREIADPWQQALIIAEFLSSRGIVIPRELDWRDLTSYTVQPGDDWESISLRELGNPYLWPLIWLLNAEQNFPHEALPVGERLLLPTPRE